MEVVRLALIPPIEHLDFTPQTNYQLMLPHLLQDEEYAKVYTRLCNDDEQYVIMDNGAAEGKQMGDQSLMIIAEEYQPDELVIPDVLGNSLMTYDSIRRFMEHAFVSYSFDGRLAMVAQGSNTRNAFELVNDVLTRWPIIDAVHIPRLLVTSEQLMARLALARKIHQHWPEVQIHLLGASSTFTHELQHAAKVEGIRGMDTSMPFNYALQYASIAEADRPINRPDDYFDMVMDMEQCIIAAENVRLMKGWAHGA